MSKTLFDPFGTVITSKWLNAVFGQGPNGGHRHDGKNADGHCAKITAEELSDDIVFKITEAAISRYVIIGEILAYAGEIKRERVDNPDGSFAGYVYHGVPDGFLLCDGELIPEDSKYDDYRAWVDEHAPQLNGPLMVGEAEIDDIIGYRTPYAMGRALFGVGRPYRPAPPNDIVNPEIILNVADGRPSAELSKENLPAHTHSVMGTISSQPLNPPSVAPWGFPMSQGNTSHAWVRDAISETGFHDGVRGRPFSTISPYLGVNFIIRASR